MMDNLLSYALMIYLNKFIYKDNKDSWGDEYVISDLEQYADDDVLEFKLNIKSGNFNKKLNLTYKFSSNLQVKGLIEISSNEDNMCSYVIEKINNQLKVYDANTYDLIFTYVDYHTVSISYKNNEDKDSICVVECVPLTDNTAKIAVFRSKAYMYYMCILDPLVSAILFAVTGAINYSAVQCFNVAAIGTRNNIGSIFFKNNNNEYITITTTYSKNDTIINVRIINSEFNQKFELIKQDNNKFTVKEYLYSDITNEWLSKSDYDIEVNNDIISTKDKKYKAELVNTNLIFTKQ